MAFDLESAVDVEQPKAKFDMSSSVDIMDFDLKSIMPTQQNFSVLSPQELENISKKGKIGWTEAVIRQNTGDLIPFSPTGIVRSMSLLNATKRLQENAYADDLQKTNDLDKVKEFARKNEEESLRGYKWYAKAYIMGSQLPAFALEFLATSGIASAGKVAVKQGATKLLGSAVEKGATRFAVGATALTAGALARSIAMPHRYMAKYGEKQVNESLAVTDKGLELLKDSNEKPFTSAMKAFGDVWIENLSEETGAYLTTGLNKIGSKVMLKSGIARKFVQEIDKLVPNKGFMTSVKKLGFNGALEEYGEERIGGALRAVTGVDDREKGVFDKLTEAFFPSPEDALLELGLFSVMGTGSFAYSTLKQRYLSKGMSETQATDILDNTTQIEKEELLNQEVEQDPEFGKQLQEEVAQQKQEARQQEAAMSEVKPVSEISPLEQEALKYDRVEDFVERQGETVYHGTEVKELKEFKDEFLGKNKAEPAKLGHWFTDNKGYAEAHGDNVVEAKLGITNPKIYTRAQWETIDKKGNFTSLRKQLEEQGYDGIKVEPTTEMVGKYEIKKAGLFSVFDTRNIKTTAQLTDIYNKAHSTKQTTSLEQEARKYKTAEEFVESNEIIKLDRQANKSQEDEKFAETKSALAYRKKRTGKFTRKALDKYKEKNGENLSDAEAMRGIQGMESQLTDIYNKAQEGKKVQPTVDNLKPSKQAERIQDKAVADKLGIVFDNISQYEAKNNKEELAKANEIIQNDYEKAKNIALGYENAPEGVMDNAVFIAVRNKAEKSNDVELMLKLAQQNSRVEQTSKFGQEVQILSQIEEDNPISAIQDVAKTKANNYEKRTKKDVKKEKKDNIKAIKESVKKEVMDGVKTWDDFLTELEC